MKEESYREKVWEIFLLEEPGHSRSPQVFNP